MLQSDQLTGTQHVNAPEGRSNSGEYAARENLVQTIDQVVSLALKQAPDALTTGRSTESEWGSAAGVPQSRRE